MTKVRPARGRPSRGPRPGRAGARRHGRIPYEPALDGIRGLAVTAVVLYHAEVRWAGGGFLGVDAFFVLSGFLITALLLVEFDGEGKIGLREFWTRRAKRLLPALFLVIAAVVAYAALIADRTELDQIRSDGLASLFYVANWKFVTDGASYFDLFRIESPFQHLWSLAIEEQWYVFWPLAVIAILKWRKGSPRAVMWVSIALALLSAAWMAYLFQPGDDPSRVYYGTGTRAQSLLVGAALAAALVSGVRVRSWVAGQLLPLVSGLIGVGLLYTWSTASDTAEWYYGGGFLLLALGVATVILAAVQPEGNAVRSALSLRPLVWLGIISYGVYLWHWPIFVVLSRQRTLLEGWSYVELTVLRLAATLVVASASYYLIERPIRRGVLGRRIRFSPVLLPVSAVLLVVLIVVTTSRGATPEFAVAEAAPGLPSGDRLEDGLDPGGRPPPGDDVGDATKVLLVGDSVAYSMAGGFTPEIQQDEQLIVWNQTVLFCELIHGPRREHGEIHQASNTCTDWRASWARDIEEFQPDVVVLQVGAWEIFDRKIGDDWLAWGTPPYDDQFAEVLREVAGTLGSSGATVVVLTSPLFDREDTLSAREWTQNEEWRIEHLNDLLADLADENPAVALLDLGGWVCPDGDCLERLATGHPSRTDGVHFTDEGAEVAAAWLSPQLRSLGIHNAATRDRTGPDGG